jgi:hypothetical protein
MTVEDRTTVGQYADGRTVVYDPARQLFFIGDAPISHAQLFAYDAHGQVSWLTSEHRQWAWEMQDWMGASVGGESAAHEAADTHPSRRSRLPDIDWQEKKEVASRDASKVSHGIAAGAKTSGRWIASASKTVGKSIEAAAKMAAYGNRNAALVCPHCQSQGTVHTKPVDQKKGIHGGKATAGILTGGVSLLATGLSRKERLTEAHCTHCGSTWRF